MNFLSPDDRDRYLCICGSKYSRTLFSDHHQMHIPSRPSAPFQNSPVRVPDRSLHNDRINHRSIPFFHPVLTPVHTEQRPARPYCQIPEWSKANVFQSFQALQPEPHALGRLQNATFLLSHPTDFHWQGLEHIQYRNYLEEQGMDETQIDEYSSLPLVIIDYNADRESPFFNTCNFNAGRAALWEHAMGWSIMSNRPKSLFYKKSRRIPWKLFFTPVK